MLSLLKKKKGSDSGSSSGRESDYENEKVNLYRPEANQTYHDFGYFLNQRPTAPTKFSSKSYSVESFLEVTTSKKLENGSEILKILEKLVDIYDGSILSKSLIIPIYIILGMRLKLSDQYLKNRFVYKNGITEVVSFTGEDKIHLKENKLEYSKNFTTKLYGEDCYVIFRVSLKTTKRKGPNVFDVYRYPINGQVIKRDIKELLKPHEIGVEIDGEGIRGLVNM
ncbi:matrix protein [Adelaide River virus]|uniref:Matrix protein n=1 Tax=Adelaide River virus TaxID=31612 RepID=K4HHN5_ARV|nr:matrix protein [Adelaide River virus]AFR23541.1 matrix protein [Adelaide River virus]